MIRTLALAAGLAISASAAQATFLGITILEGNSAAATTAIGQSAQVYQIYAVYDGTGTGQDGTNNSNTVLTTSFANITLNGGATFFNTPMFGTDLPPNPAFFPLVETLQFDSFGTIGALNLSVPGAASIGVEPATMGVPSGITSTQVNGGWFNGNPPSNIGAAGVVDGLAPGQFGTVLFQLTVLGGAGIDAGVGTLSTFTGSGPASPFDTRSDFASNLFSQVGVDSQFGIPFGFSVFEQGAGIAIRHDITFVPIPTPGALALFGVAGLAASRRRRA